MDAIAWFMAGMTAATAGAVGGTLLNGWSAWGFSLGAGILLTALSGRFSTYAGAVFVVGAVGALIVPGTGAAVLMAVLSVLLCGGGALAGRYGWRSLWTATERPSPSSSARSSPSKKTVRPSPAPSSVSERLSKREVDALLALAEEDTDRFKERLRRLTPSQRQQVRDAFYARKQHPTPSSK